MPEMVLADFLCNELYQRNSLRGKPANLEAGHWLSIVFEEDPFWRDISFFKSQGLWERMVLELTSRRGRQWRCEHPKVSDEINALTKQALRNCVGCAPRQILAVLKKEILAARDWEQALLLIQGLEKNLDNAPPHLLPYIQWHLNILGWDVANHRGDGAEAARRFSLFRSCLEQQQFQRLEFYREVPEFFNRHAVSLSDRYEFEAAEKILNEALAMERRFLGVSVTISGKEHVPERSDSLGKIYSTLGQLYTKMAARDSSLAAFALECIDESVIHLQQSCEPNRQRNYRIEALLASGEGKAQEIFELLTRDEAFADAASLFAAIAPDSFDMLYWLRWIAATESPMAEDYAQAALATEGAFLDLNGGAYPQMSILYHFGRIAACRGTMEAARRAWRRAAEGALAPAAKREIRAGVLDTLRLRPLCALALNFPEEREAASHAVSRLLEAISGSDLLDGGYFSRYPVRPADGLYENRILYEMERDIPYS
jgi:hypothetical protein